MCNVTTTDIERKLQAAQALYDGATTAGEKLAALKAVSRLKSKLVELPALTKHKSMTVDGTPLSELGLGLGPTTNGKDCPNPKCGGRGYETHHGPAWKVCPVETCFRGLVTYKHWDTVEHITRYCFVCDGLGQVRASGNVYYVKCRQCDGTGEVINFNPVIPKGALRS